MDAITALLSRNSVNRLTAPGPTSEQMQTIIGAGLRACDHGNLRPWRFLVIEGHARAKFGELMVKVKTAQDGAEPSKELAERLRNKPFRAPTMIVVVADVKQHDKVPEIEQVLSAGASAQMMMAAAHALGVGAIWRSGSLMFHPEMKKGLNLGQHQQIVGFIYLGTPSAVKPLPKLAPEDFVTHWQGEA